LAATDHCHAIIDSKEMTFEYEEPELEDCHTPDLSTKLNHAHTKLERRLNRAYTHHIRRQRSHDSLNDTFFQSQPSDGIALGIQDEALPSDSKRKLRQWSNLIKRHDSVQSEHEDDILSPAPTSTSLLQLEAGTSKDKAKRHNRLQSTIRRKLKPSAHLEAALQAMQAAALTEEDAYALDSLYECQRGFISLFGSPHFASAALLQFDPKAWVYDTMLPCPFSPRNYPLPGPDWHWLHPQWLIDMTADVECVSIGPSRSY
jgi:hypothetical protein